MNPTLITKAEAARLKAIANELRDETADDPRSVYMLPLTRLERETLIKINALVESAARIAEDRP